MSQLTEGVIRGHSTDETFPIVGQSGTWPGPRWANNGSIGEELEFLKDLFDVFFRETVRPVHLSIFAIIRTKLKRTAADKKCFATC